MADKKYQVFVSSTFRDLVEERQDTIRTILDMKHIPAGMELFPAADVDQLVYIKKVIEECDYYLLIVGGRYGSLDAEGISFTEREYDYAVEKGKFVVAFVHGTPGSISVDNSDIEPKLAEALKAFRDKVMSGRLIKAWTNRTDLQLAVFQSLMLAFSTYPQTGWIRGDAAASTDMLEQSNAILQENARLRTELDQMKIKTPKLFEDLADMDEKYRVRYTIRVPTDYGLFETQDRSNELTWYQIFMHVAAQLGAPKRDGAISTAMAEALKEVYRQDRFASLNDTDRARIKSQLRAYNLVEVYTDKTEKGVDVELMKLTERGQDLYMDLSVVRRAGD